MFGTLFVSLPVGVLDLMNCLLDASRLHINESIRTYYPHRSLI